MSVFVWDSCARTVGVADEPKINASYIRQAGMATACAICMRCLALELCKFSLKKAFIRASALALARMHNTQRWTRFIWVC